MNETQGKSYDPVALTPKEDEIRRSGGIFAMGRREFGESVRTAPTVEWPDPETARGLTTTEQILWAHRVDRQLVPVLGRADGEEVRVRLGRHLGARRAGVARRQRRRRPVAQERLGKLDGEQPLADALTASERGTTLVPVRVAAAFSAGVPK